MAENIGKSGRREKGSGILIHISVLRRRGGGAVSNTRIRVEKRIRTHEGEICLC